MDIASCPIASSSTSTRTSTLQRLLISDWIVLTASSVIAPTDRHSSRSPTLVMHCDPVNRSWLSSTLSASSAARALWTDDATSPDSDTLIFSQSFGVDISSPAARFSPLTASANTFFTAVLVSPVLRVIASTICSVLVSPMDSLAAYCASVLIFPSTC